jgi:hypothetical protein
LANEKIMVFLFSLGYEVSTQVLQQKLGVFWGMYLENTVINCLYWDAFDSEELEIQLTRDIESAIFFWLAIQPRSGTQ